MAVSIDSYKVRYTTSKSPKTRIKENSFGMGYRQIIEDGPNSDEESWNVDFTPLDTTGILALESILLDSVKTTNNYLSWTPPGEDTIKYYTAHDIQKKPLSSTLWYMTCTLRREFPLV